MSNISKKLSVVLAAAMLCGMASGCSGSNSSSQSQSQSSSSASTAAPSQSQAQEEENPTKDAVTLEWYVAEKPHAGDDVVLPALNQYFQEKINATVNIHFIDPSEYKDKMSPILMSGQTADIINANGTGTSSISYVNYVNQETFAPIEELLPKYAPNLWDLIPENFWKTMEINGHIYGVPSYKDSVDIRSVVINQTMADELGMGSYEGKTIKNMQEVVPWMYEAYEKRNEKHPEDLANDIPISRCFFDLEDWTPSEDIVGFVVANIPGVEAYAGKGKGETVFHKYETDEYRQYCQTRAKMVNEGVLPVDVWNYDTERVYSAQGKYFVEDTHQGLISVTKNQFSDQWDSTLVLYDQAVGSTAYVYNAVNCISATCKNPERAVMALELINTDNFVATTIRFGVEGTHWKMSDVQGVLDFTGTANEDVGNRAYYSWYGAQFGAITSTYVPAGWDADFAQKLIAENEKANLDTNMGFVFDPTPVQNEISACSAKEGEYTKDLKWGFLVNQKNTDPAVVEATVNQRVDEFIAAMKEAGVDKVVEEAQKQLDAWRAEHKK